MKISKYVHSCLLFEDGETRLLFDPGKFSFVDGRVEPETFSGVSAVVITHDHPDHLYLPALKEIVEASGAPVLSNGEVAAKLGAEGIEVDVFEEGTRQVGTFSLQAIPTEHEPILSDELPQHTAFLVDERVLNPGDSFRDTLLPFAGVELLVLPVMAPFLTELGAVDFAHRMRPQGVLPVHDGYARDYFLEQRYETYGPYFDEHQITFHALKRAGESIHV